MNGEEKKCDVCGVRPANVFFKKTVNGKTVEMQLCSHCYNEMRGDEDWIDSCLFGGNIAASVLGVPFGMPRSAKKRVCPVCGATEEQIADSFKFGCSACYDTFYDLAKSYVAQLGGTGYKGRKPDFAAAAKEGAAAAGKAPQSREERIKALEEAKRLAVEKEDFDEALRLKKEIEAISKE